jgi:hypothetical protein
MPVSIVATPGDPTANSFVTVAEMTAYCDGRMNASAWVNTDTTLHAALVEATRDISNMDFIGARVTATQALSWPRDSAANADLAGTNDNLVFDLLNRDLPLYYDPTIIPQRVKDATCELALQYVKSGTTDLAAADPNKGVIEKSVGPLTTRWESSQARAEGLARFPRVVQLLYPLLRPSAGAVRLRRV